MIAIPTQGVAFDWLYADGNSQQPSTLDESPSSVGAPPHSVCIAAILTAEQEYGIPENLLLAIGLQEAGIKRDGILTVWPWTVNSAGVGYRFDNQYEAISFANSERFNGRESFDVGCLQVNMKWHADAFADLDSAFDPLTNARYAASFLTNLKNEAGSWMVAAGNYHSKTPEHHARYSNGIERNLNVATQNSTEFLALASLAEGVQQSTSGSSGATIRSTTSLDRKFSTSLLRPGERRSQLERIERKRALLRQNSRSFKPSEPTPSVETQLKGTWWTAEISNAASDTKKRTIYSVDGFDPALPELVEVTQ